jgi:hypothetical protein
MRPVLGREVAEHGHREDGHPRRLVPDTGARRRGDGVAEDEAGDDPDHTPKHELPDEIPRRTGEGEATGLGNAYQGQGEHRARDVVEGRFGYHRLGDFGPELEAVEEGDEDGGVRRRQDGSDEQGHGEGHPEHGPDHKRDDHGRYKHAGQDEKAEADGGTGDHTQGDAGSAVKQDEGHPDVEEELGPNPVEGIGDDPEHRRPDQGSRRDEHHHLGNLYERRYELGDEPGPEYEAEVAKDKLYFHPLPDQGYELFRQRSPAQVLHAVPAHDLLAPPPILLRQPQIVGERLCQFFLEVVHADAQVEGQALAHDPASLREARVVCDEGHDAARRELCGHQPEGLREDGRHRSRISRRKEPGEIPVVDGSRE